MKPKDYILISIYVVAALAGMAFSLFHGSTGNAYIYVSGQLYGVYDLSDNADIHIESDDGIINDIAIDEGGIYMKNATCPYRECMKMGKICKNGETICCLPAKVVIIVRSDEEAVYDAITR